MSSLLIGILTKEIARTYKVANQVRHLTLNNQFSGFHSI